MASNRTRQSASLQNRLFLLTVHSLLLTILALASCGGDDNKDGGGASSGGSAKARAKIAWEEWAKRGCEINSVCQPDQFVKSFGTVEKCKAGVDEDISRSSDSRSFLNQPEACYTLFIDSYETCTNAVVAQDPKTLCEYHGVFFYNSKTEKTIYEVFPECGIALGGVDRAEAECGLSQYTFLGVPQRH